MKPFVKWMVEDFDKMLKLYGRKAHRKLTFYWYVKIFLELNKLSML